MKRWLACIILLLVISTTACSSDSSQLSEIENDMIAEYMAGTLLKYDKNYEEKLVYQIEDDTSAGLVETTTEKLPLDKTTEDNNVEETTVTEDNTQVVEEYIELNEVFNLPEFDITYMSYGFYDSYPNNPSSSYFTLETKDDSKLLIIEFNVKNLSNKKKRISLMDQNIEYQLNLNHLSVSKPSITLLLNDLQYLELNVDAKKTTTAVLVFEVKEQSEINKLELYISKSDKTSMIKMK